MLLVKGREWVKHTKIINGSLLLALLWRFAMHEIVETRITLEQDVEAAHDAEDPEGEDPDADDGNDGCSVAAEEPAEDCEESC